MHLYDGLLSVPVLTGTHALSAVAVIPAVRRVNRSLLPEQIPRLGLAACFVFALQLASFPLPGGFSVHLLGSVLISRLVGPAAGLLIVVSSLFLQALLFQHGGLLSLGANVFNIGVIGCLGGGGLARWLSNSPAANALCAWLATAAGAACLVLELVLSRRAPASLGALAGVYVLTGMLEGALTWITLAALRRRGRLAR